MRNRSGKVSGECSGGKSWVSAGQVAIAGSEMTGEFVSKKRVRNYSTSENI